MTSDYNNNRVKTKTIVWDKDEIDIYNDYYYSNSNSGSNNRDYIDNNYKDKSESS